MKFALAVVVVLAVAMGVQSSLIAGAPHLGLGLGINGLGINGLGLPWGVPGIGLGLGVRGIVGPGWLGGPLISAAHIPAAVNVVSSPLGGIAVAQQAAIAPGHGATYVAKTRGAIHTAPLAGHINSVASANLAPAPGTW